MAPTAAPTFAPTAEAACSSGTVVVAGTERWDGNYVFASDAQFGNWTKVYSRAPVEGSTTEAYLIYTDSTVTGARRSLSAEVLDWSHRAVLRDPIKEHVQQPASVVTGCEEGQFWSIQAFTPGLNNQYLPEYPTYRADDCAESPTEIFTEWQEIAAEGAAPTPLAADIEVLCSAPAIPVIPTVQPTEQGTESPGTVATLKPRTPGDTLAPPDSCSGGTLTVDGTAWNGNYNWLPPVGSGLALWLRQEEVVGDDYVTLSLYADSTTATGCSWTLQNTGADGTLVYPIFSNPDCNTDPLAITAQWSVQECQDCPVVDAGGIDLACAKRRLRGSARKQL